MAMRHVHVNGIKLAYELREPEGGVAPGHDGVLMIMGFQARGHAWRGQAERLVAEGFPVCWFDNRGVGETEARPGRWTTATIANDALALMDVLGWERAHLVGVSMGGMIAQELALTPGALPRLTSLTLVATHPGGPVNRLPTFDGLRRFARANGIRGKGGSARVRERLGILFPLDWLDSLDKPSRDALMADLRRSFNGPKGQAPSASERLSQFSIVLSHDTRRRLPRITGLPTLVISPGRDLLIRPRACLDIAHRIPGAKLLQFPEAGHGVLRQCRTRVNEALVDHLVDAQGVSLLDHRGAAA